MKRIFSNWQGLAALLIASAIFYFSPSLLRMLDPTAGTFDVGYLQRPLVAAAWFFFVDFCVWTIIQTNWKTADRWIDSGGFRRDWESLLPRQRIAYFMVTIFVLLAAFLYTLANVPVS